MKFYITGSGRGLGQRLREEFNCISFDRPDDVSLNIDAVINQIEAGSVVILNAHASGSQLEYVEKLKDKCWIVVCGSVAAVNHDSNMIEYSKQKKQLEERITQLSLHNQHPILYLRLTSSSYRDHQLIINTIKFWLDNPQFTFAGYNINE
jgi:hypothetical protein